ncbi:chalcone-flavanone isomerase-domain-containing protein [Epithele typhae]|uniref:chalcone-flavanone isomerase-domain-containing protein n=1 Tax=Epithele typhae TaxID=378194 RepID=UPI0020076A5E|nr:chalcone-flavanone isomerase-domain-containing protein [Epithele typhae]KAH9922006.1 chalcone-flavanone isomerase-domain-containing protein [Epithele typhae]
MSWLHPTLLRSAQRGCRSFAASAPSRLSHQPNSAFRTLVQRRSHTTALFWGTAIAAAAALTLSSTIYLDAPPGPGEDTRVDPASKIAFPTKLVVQSKTPLLQFSLIGVGVRTVSFLGIQVYSIGFYTDLANPKLKEMPHDASPEEKIRFIVDNGACLLRIIPTRSTSYGHLRDGFMRAMVARQNLLKGREELSKDEEFAIQTPLRRLKSMFPNTPLAKHSPLDILITSPSSKEQRTLVVRDMGDVQSDWLARNFVLAYFEGDGISPPLKKSVIEYVQIHF